MKDSVTCSKLIDKW